MYKPKSEPTHELIHLAKTISKLIDVLEEDQITRGDLDFIMEHFQECFHGLNIVLTDEFEGVHPFSRPQSTDPVKRDDFLVVTGDLFYYIAKQAIQEAKEELTAEQAKN